MNERELTSSEKEFLSFLLPERKGGYKKVKDELKDYKTKVKKDSSLILCREGSFPDPDFRTNDIFAAGIIIFENNKVDISISSLSEGCAEFDISYKNDQPAELNGKIIKRWNYSEWDPGQKAPGDNSDVREIQVSGKEYILVIAPLHKKIWLHESQTGVNHLIPVTNYYSHLMMVKGIRDPAVVLKPSLFFDDIWNYSDEEMQGAFILYNRYFNKFRLPVYDDREKKKPVLKYFKRG